MMNLGLHVQEKISLTMDNYMQHFNLKVTEQKKVNKILGFIKGVSQLLIHEVTIRQLVQNSYVEHLPPLYSSNVRKPH